MADRRKKTMVWVPRDLLGVLQEALHDNSPPGSPWTLQRTVEWALIRGAWALVGEPATGRKVPEENAAVIRDRLIAVGAVPESEHLLVDRDMVLTDLRRCEVCLTTKADNRSEEDRDRRVMFVCARCGAEEG